LPLHQDVPSVRQIIEDHADLGGLHISFPALFRDGALLVQELAQDRLFQILEHRGFLLLVRHLLQLLPEWGILRVQLDGGREDPHSGEHVLVVTEEDVENDHGFA
jgi:hypothetical protein